MKNILEIKKTGITGMFLLYVIFCVGFVSLCIASEEQINHISQNSQLDFKEEFNGKSGLTVIHIQDAHCVYEAQKDIASLLDSLVLGKNIPLVAVEGAVDVIETGEYSSFPDNRTKRLAADYMMKNGYISGAEYFSIISPKPFLLTGLEDRELYKQNYGQFQKTLGNALEVNEDLDKLKKIVTVLENHYYNDGIKKIIWETYRYKSGGIDLSEYCGKFLGYAAESGLKLDNYPNLNKIINLSIVEKKINPSKLYEERQTLIRNISRKISAGQIKQLMETNLRFKIGKLDAESYHNYLANLAKTYNIDISLYPQLSFYLEYISQYKKIHLSKSNEELDNLKDALISRHIETEYQKQLYSISKTTILLPDICRLSLPVTSYNKYSDSKNGLNPQLIYDSLMSLAVNAGLENKMPSKFNALAKTMPYVEAFYATAKSRDEAMVSKLIKKMEQSGAKTAVFITGGFHTQGIFNELRKNDISYKLITPKITVMPTHTNYIELMSGRQTAFDWYLSKSTLAIASWLERTPIVSPHRNIGLGYRMKTLMIGGYAFEAAKAEPVKAVKDAKYLKNKIDTLLKLWGRNNYKDIEVREVFFTGAYLNVTIKVYGKELHFLFTDSNKSGKAMFKSAEGLDVEVAFNSNGEIGVIDENDLGNFHFKVITPQSFQSLQNYANNVLNKGTEPASIKEGMEHRLIILLMEEQLNTPSEFRSALLKYNITLSNDELNFFFRSLGFVNPNLSADRNIASSNAINSSLLGAYLSVKAINESLFIDNKSLPVKAKNAFDTLGFSSIYIEEGTPAGIMSALFKKLAMREINLASEKEIELFQPGDEKVKYLVNALKDAGGKIFLKVEKALTEHQPANLPLTPSNIEELLNYGIDEIKTDSSAPIKESRMGVVFIESVDDKITLSVIGIGKGLKLEETELKVSLNLLKHPNRFESTISKLKSMAAKNDIQLMGVFVDKHGIITDRHYFSNLDDFEKDYYSELAKYEIAQKLKAKHGRNVKVTVVSRRYYGINDKIMAIKVNYSLDGKDYCEFLTEKTKKGSKDKRFNIGLEEFLMDKSISLKTEAGQFKPSEKLNITFDKTSYTLVREQDSGAIRLKLPNSMYSYPLTDGEAEFIKAMVSNKSYASIEHTPAYPVAKPSSTKLTPLYWDAWRKRSLALKTGDTNVLINDVIPFIAQSVLGYEDYLTKEFGHQVTVVDLFGFHGELMDQLMRKYKQQDVRMDINPYIIEGDLFYSAMAKKIMEKHGLERDRVVSIDIGNRGNRDLNMALHALRGQQPASQNKIVPHVITMAGSGLEYGITSYEDAYQLCAEVNRILPMNGIFFIAGLDFLSLNAEDFEKLGFAVIESGNVDSFFNPMVHPKQYYALKKIKHIPLSQINKEERAPEADKAGSEKTDLIAVLPKENIPSPASGILDFYNKLSNSGINLYSSLDHQQYSINIIPKLKIPSRTNGPITITNINDKTINASEEKIMYFDIYLSSKNTTSLLPVMSFKADFSLGQITVDSISLEAVNFNGILKDMRGMGFTRKITNYIHSLMPDMAVMSVPALSPSINYDAVTAIYEVLIKNKKALPDEPYLKARELLDKINKNRNEGKPIEKLVIEIANHTLQVYLNILSLVKTPEILELLNSQLFLISNLPPISDYIDSGFEEAKLVFNENTNEIAPELSKRTESIELVASGSLRSNITFAQGKGNTEEINAIKEKLTQIENLLIADGVIPEGYFSSVNFKFIKGGKTQLLPQDIEPNTITLSYDLIFRGFNNIELLLMEIKQGIKRLELSQMPSELGVAPFNSGALELYTMLSYIQDFIELGDKGKDSVTGISLQARVLQLLEPSFGQNERAIYHILNYIHKNNIRGSWFLRNILVDLIGKKGEFSETNIYSAEITDGLNKLNSNQLIDEINRIMNLFDYKFIKRSVVNSPTCVKILNIRAHKESTVKEILNGNEVQVGYLKIQNFKDVFNTFGADLGVGHFFGDIGIYVVGKYLQDMLQNAIEQTGGTVTVGNSGADYFLTFSNTGSLDILELLDRLVLNPNADFKRKVVEEIKIGLRNHVDQKTYESISAILESGFDAEKLHFYAGVSQKLERVKPRAETTVDLVSESAKTADLAYDQAFKAAKHTQIQFSSTYNEIRKNILTKGSAGLKDTTPFSESLKESAKVLKSGILRFSNEIQEEINQNRQIGLANEYDFFQEPISGNFKIYNSIDSLGVNLLSAIESHKKQEILSELKDRIMETFLLYQSKFLSEEYIYQGSDNFRRVINYIISRQPEYNLSRAFRLGGDEYGKLVWNSKTKKLRIYRLDGNNVGATNQQWGKEIGDKMIDESLRIISEIDDLSNLQDKISFFFENMGDKGIVISQEQFEAIKRKDKKALLLDEEHYKLLIGTQTFSRFTKSNSIVAVKRNDNSYIIVKFPDINVPLVIQKNDMKFDIKNLPYNSDSPTAQNITVLAGSNAVDFKIIKSGSGGSIIITSSNLRAPKTTEVNLNDIKNGKPVLIQINGYGAITLKFSIDYNTRIKLEADLISINEREFQKIKLVQGKLAKKDNKLAVMVTSRPIVSGGYIDIDAAKIQSGYLNKDISVIERRADTAGEDAKAEVKLYQVLNNGAINLDYCIQPSANDFTGSTSEMMSFNDNEPSFWDILVSRFIIEDPKEKLNRRLDYLLNRNLKLQANDIHTLNEIYHSAYMVSDKRKTELLLRIATYYNLADDEIKNLIASTLAQIIDNPDKKIWEPAVTLFINSISKVGKTKEAAWGFWAAIDGLSNAAANIHALDEIKENQPLNIIQWTKAMINLREIGSLREIKSYTPQNINILIETQNRLLPLAKQYGQLYRSGHILESPEPDQSQNALISITGLFDIYKLYQTPKTKDVDMLDYYSELTFYASSKVYEALKPIIQWNGLNFQSQELVSRFIENMVIDDSIEKVFGEKLNLGEISKIIINPKDQKSAYNSYRLIIEKTNGTKIGPLVIRFMLPAQDIFPVQNRKFITPQALKDYINRKTALNSAEPDMFNKAGGYYEITTSIGEVLRIITEADTSGVTSRNLMDSFYKKHIGDELDVMLKNVLTTDIISYMRLWDILGRSMFVRSPSPENIFNGREVAGIEAMDYKAKPSDMLDKFYKGYQIYNKEYNILEAVIKFFNRYDGNGEYAGFDFLIKAYMEMEKDGKQQDIVYQDLKAFLENKKLYLSNIVKGNNKYDYKQIAELIHLKRVLGDNVKQTKHLPFALTYIENYILTQQTTQLNYRLWKDTLNFVEAKMKLSAIDKQKLGESLMDVFTEFRYKPINELSASVQTLRNKRVSTDIDDTDIEALITTIEELETAVSMKAADNYSSISFNGITYDVHPYLDPIENNQKDIGNLGYEDALVKVKYDLTQLIKTKGEQVLVSISGRPLGGKEKVVEAFLTNGVIDDENSIGVIDLTRLPKGSEKETLTRKFNDLKDKKIIIFYGDSINAITSYKIDYSVFVESDEITRARHIIQSGNETLIKNLKSDNILYRWGLFESNQPKSVDAQRSYANVIINMSLPEISNINRRVKDPKTIASYLRGIPVELSKTIVNDLQTIANAFADNTAKKTVLLVEPTHPSQGIAMAMMGMNVTILSDKQDILRFTIKPEDLFRIKNAGGSISVLWSGSKSINTDMKPHNYNLVFIDDATTILNPSSGIYQNSQKETALKFINMLADKGIIMFSPETASSIFIGSLEEAKDKLFPLSNDYITNETLSRALMRKIKKDEELSAILQDSPIIDILTENYNNALQRRPFIITIDYDNIAKYLNQHDIDIFAKALRSKQEQYNRDNINVKFAFVSNEYSAKDIRQGLSIKPVIESNLFFVLGKEDISADTLISKKPFFYMAIDKLTKLSGNPLSNILFLESSTDRMIEAVDSSAITVDTSGIFDRGFFLENIFGLINFLDKTISLNKIDMDIDVTMVSADNSLFGKFQKMDSQTTVKLAELADKNNISYNTLRGLVVRIPNISDIKANNSLKRSKFSHLIETSL